MDTHSEEVKNRNMASLSSQNYCYVDQIHNTFAHNSQDIYNLATGMENMISYPPSKAHLPDPHSATWKDLFSSSNGASSSKAGFYHFNPENTEESMIPSPQDHNTYVDDSSLRCVFPCEGNERPSQGLSLSLSSTNPSAIGLQSFELRHPSDQGYFPKSTDQVQQSHHDHNMAVQEGYFGKSINPAYTNDFFPIRASKYLGPAQDLLNEFCNLGNKETGTKSSKAKARDNENATPSPSPGTFLELQKRKGRLLAMLEEVDRRYRHYCDQMKAVVSSFEAMAGNGAALIYSEMASKAMSRHFRALRDGIVSHIKATKKAMGEKDTSAPGMTRGETPRLRVLDQTLRQQRAFQQMNMMESHPWRPQRGLPERSVSVLRAWLFEHFLHPYPSDVDKHILARQTGLSRSQVSNWFINARVRLWKPMVEEMYVEETKEQDNTLASNDENNIGRPCQSHNPHAHTEDQKPTMAQLGRIDSECLSSIIINPDKNDNERHHHHQNQNHHHQSFGRVSEPFGAVELDFSSYGHHQGFGNASASGSGVSLTLGLQQHGEKGVSLAFTSAPQGSLFYPRDHMEDCQTVQFSLLDGEAQNLPYRNLMGAQMLHDLAG